MSLRTNNAKHNAISRSKVKEKETKKFKKPAFLFSVMADNLFNGNMNNCVTKYKVQIKIEESP